MDHLKKKFRGMRTGRASASIIGFVKVDYSGDMQHLKNIAAISIPEPAQLLVKPFDASSIQAIKKAAIGPAVGVG